MTCLAQEAPQADLARRGEVLSQAASEVGVRTDGSHRSNGHL